jgi:hypothetical protein
VSVDVSEGNGGSIGAIVTSTGSMLLRGGTHGIATRRDFFGISPAFSWNRKKVVLSSLGRRYGMSARP